MKKLSIFLHGGALAGLALALVAVGLPASATAPPVHTRIPSEVRIAPPSFADLVDAVKPAVVNISTRGKVKDGALAQLPEFNFPPGSPFEDFFDRFFEQEGPGKGGIERKVNALGSGFIISPDGYVVTNHHVVKSADEITVITQDGTQYKAEVRGADDKTDLALLKIEADVELPYVAFGNSDKARVGDWVVAIGNPFGLGGTATTGIVSARGRYINSGPLDDYLQIDAPINRGNSGGPLFDSSGRVIGVNTAIFSPNGGNVGIGFAIPASIAQSVIGQLKDKGRVDRGWLGVEIQQVTDDLANSLGLDKKQGALVSSVVKDSPAERAGIEVGDVILTFDNKDVQRMRKLPRIVAETPAGKEVAIEVWRDGKHKTLNARVGDSPQEVKVAQNSDSDADSGQLGLSLAPITPETQRRFRLADGTEGVLVVGVKPNSPAAEKGIRPGDVITRVGSKQVKAPEDVVAAVANSRSNSKTVLLLVQRGDNRHFVALKLA